MGDKLTGGYAVELLRKVYHARKDEMPEGWIAEWRSGSMTMTLGNGYDANKAVKELREFEESSGMKGELKRIASKNNFIPGKTFTKKYTF